MADPYISEVKYLGGANKDFIEIAVTTGTDVSNLQVIVYNADGTVRTTNALGSVVNTVAGKDVYVIDTATSSTFNGLHKFGAVALYDAATNTVHQFISFTDNAAAVTATEGPANGLTSTEIGQAGAGQSLESTDGGNSYHVLDPPSKGTTPCFLSGTLVLTESGERPIEDLRPGDRVITLDHGAQEILWAGRTRIMPSRRAARLISEQPITIRAHAFGPDLPRRDLHVSPNHRVLLDHYRCQLDFGCAQLLAAAGHLVNGTTILRSATRAPILYHHLLFERHEIIFTENLPTESLYPSAATFEAFPPEARASLPERYPSACHLARPQLRAFEACCIAEAILAPTPESPPPGAAMQGMRQAYGF